MAARREEGVGPLAFRARWGERGERRELRSSLVGRAKAVGKQLIWSV